MAAAWCFYDSFTKTLVNGTHDLDTATIKVMIVTSSYTPNNTHENISEVDPNEVASTGYTTGGETLSGITLTTDNATHKTKFDASDISLSGVTFTNARYAVLYKSSGGDLIGYVDFGVNLSPSAQAFNIVWNASGIFTINIGSGFSAP